MPEFIKTAEVIGNILERAYKVGKFVVNHISTEKPPIEPIEASIVHYNSGDKK